MKPIIIYNNNTFNKISFENKYRNVVENELKCFNKTWNDVFSFVNYGK